jgi:two-component system chemotaxis response regulator CheB
VIPIRLAVVDDSNFFRKAVKTILDSEPQIEVVGLAATGEELIENLDRWKPDIITLDLSMPGMGGLKTLEQILAHRHIPVIILSTHSKKDAPLTIEALHRGAVDFIDKQEHSLLNFEGLRALLMEKILSVAARTTESVHQALAARASASQESPVPARTHLPQPAAPLTGPAPQPARRVEALLIGASTGGPPAIQTVLEALGDRLPVPVAIVQHMPIGFTKAFAQRLDAHLPFVVTEAILGEPFDPGTVYIAPAGFHLRLRQEGNRVVVATTIKPESAPHRPSVDILFDSAATIYGCRTLAVLLTGMGRDGAEGLLTLRDAGAHTIAQDEETCVVYGMPKSAVQLGAAREQLPLERIGPRIAEFLKA